MRKRPFLTRRSGFGVGRVPIPGEEVIEPAHRVSVGHAFQDILEISERLDIIELGSR